MADAGLRSMLLSGALLWTACSRDKIAPSEPPTPSPSSTAPAQQPRERRESAEPPILDPTKKPPAGYRRMAVGGVAPTPEGNAVVLTDETRRGLLLYVGGEGTAEIRLGSARSDHRRFNHAASGLAHDRSASDLLDNVLKKLGGDVVSVKIDRIEDDVYYGSLLISKDGRLFELEARPTESISLAIGNSVPVFVAESVMVQAGVDVDKLDFRRLRESHEEHEGPEKAAVRPGEVEL